MADALLITRVLDRVAVVGELAMPSDCDLLRTCVEEAIALAQTERPIVTLDVAAAVRFDNTRVLATLVGLARKCADAGVTLALEGTTEEFRELLTVTRMDQLFALRGATVGGAP